MPRIVVQAHGLAKAFAGTTLLEDASFQVEAGERIALVGHNGAGKSTLLSIVAGTLAPDAGRLDVAPGVRLRFFHQHPVLARDARVEDVLAADAGVPPALAAELGALEGRLADPTLYESGAADDVLKRFAALQREIGRARSRSAQDPTDDPVVEALGFGASDLERPAAELSGGERTRLFLAKTLSGAGPEDLLVLDEPTNHLDVETIEWLEGHLTGTPWTIILVAHDRAFLDAVTTRVLAFGRKRLASYPGDYTSFVDARDADESRLRARREKEAQELARQRAVVQQFRHQKRFDGQMASRLKRIARYRAAIDRTPDPLVEKVRFDVGLQEATKTSKDVLSVRDLTKRFGERVLFEDAELELTRGDRVALVGPNGCGKTTLLRMITGRDRPDAGVIEYAGGVRGAYYAQGNEGLELDATAGDEVKRAKPGLGDDDVRALLGRFGFRAENAPSRRVAGLSGGERARLALLRCVIAPSNLLILDEPTNHLDIDSREVLVHALNAYTGTILVVSHDRWFLDSVVDKVAVVGRRRIRVFVGDLTSVRAEAEVEAFAVETQRVYVVRKGFKDFEGGVRHAYGARLALTPEQFNSKRIYRTALSLGWIELESG